MFFPPAGSAQRHDIACGQSQTPRNGSEFAGDHTGVSLEQLLIEHLPQVRFIARCLWARTRFYVELEDLIGYGMLGLMDAVRKFDPSRGVLLKTYAEHRIRGAILDGLRAMDWLSRSARREAKIHDGDHGTPIEADGCYQRAFHQRPARFTEEAMGSETFPRARHEDELQSLPPSQEAILDQKQRRSALAGAIEHLPERQKDVLKMYYQRELSMRQIAALLGIHESRVSQIHLAAIMRLRKTLSPETFGSMRANRIVAASKSSHVAPSAIAV